MTLTYTPYAPESSVTPDLIRLPATGGPLRVVRTILRYETLHAPQFIDVTGDVERVVAGSGIAEGTVTVFSRHTTAAIKINEHEPELLKDLARMLASVAPAGREYFHNDFTVRWANMVEDECPNGHAHCQHLVLGTSETVPLMDGRLMFGRWQRIFLIELDHARERDVVVSVMGC
ncbi:MAG TPA: secondary thiamine-phosphate synthase enzyme YjbQ [Chloroflexota bacterium]|nr:secondary thiamine-phosphate synthase enzyme YjbQ [Chloroflexota bacterium]